MDFVGRSVLIVDCRHACVQDHHSDAFLHEAPQRHFRLTCEAVKVKRPMFGYNKLLSVSRFPWFLGMNLLQACFKTVQFYERLCRCQLANQSCQTKVANEKTPEIHAISGAMTQTRLYMSVLWWDRKKDHGPPSCIPGRKKDERRIWGEKHFDSLKNLRNHVTKRPKWLSLPWHGASVTITTSFSCAVHGK